MQSSPLFQYARSRFLRFVVTAELLILTALAFSIFSRMPSSNALLSAARSASPSDSARTEEKHFIKWVDFTVSNEALRQALRLDVDSFTSDCHLNWIELLAYLAARYGGDFSRYRAADMDALAERIKGGASMQSLTENMKYYAYYLEAYTAVLGGMVGAYRCVYETGIDPRLPANVIHHQARVIRQHNISGAVPHCAGLNLRILCECSAIFLNFRICSRLFHGNHLTAQIFHDQADFLHLSGIAGCKYDSVFFHILSIFHFSTEYAFRQRLHSCSVSTRSQTSPSALKYPSPSVISTRLRPSSESYSIAMG